MEKQNPGPKAGDPERRRLSRWKGFYIKNALLSPGPSPRGSPRRARAAQLQPPGDKGSRGDSRTPQSSPSPAHPGQRHLHSRGGSAERGRLRVRVRPAARTRRPSTPTGGCEPPRAPRASPGGDPDWTRRRFRAQDRKRASPRERAPAQPEVAIVSRGRRLLEEPSALVGPWGLGAAGAALDLCGSPGSWPRWRRRGVALRPLVAAAGRAPPSINLAAGVEPLSNPRFLVLTRPCHGVGARWIFFGEMTT
jgi:hypothetical protein